MIGMTVKPPPRRPLSALPRRAPAAIVPTVEPTLAATAWYWYVVEAAAGITQNGT